MNTKQFLAQFESYVDEKMDGDDEVALFFDGIEKMWAQLNEVSLVELLAELPKAMVNREPRARMGSYIDALGLLVNSPAAENDRLPQLSEISALGAQIFMPAVHRQDWFDFLSELFLAYEQTLPIYVSLSEERRAAFVQKMENQFRSIVSELDRTRPGFFPSDIGY